MLRLLCLVFALSVCSPTLGHAPQVDYYATLAFRESPYAPHLGIHRLSAEQAAERNHYRFEYAADGRIRSISFRLGDQLRPPNHTANYFWYASAEHYQYEGDTQIVRYRDQHNQPRAVHGQVWQSRYRLDGSDRRVRLSYADADGNPTESAWGIARYAWQHQDDGSVVETRRSLSDEPVHLRPGFEFDRIRLGYGATGLTQLMQHIGPQGEVIAGSSGFAQDRFTYTRHGELARYEVLDAHGQRSGSNMQGIASGLLSFSEYGYEHVASYEDAQGQPAYNDNGWWVSERRYDDHGNMLLNAFADRDGKRVNNPATGYAELRFSWHEDGLRRRELAYFDASGQPAEHRRRGMHAVRYRYDDRERPQLTYLVDREGQLVEHAVQGWAITRYQYSDDGAVGVTERLTLRQALDAELQHQLEQLHRVSAVPGMAAAIAENGQLVWHGEAGFADLERSLAVTPKTQFRLASVSKAVTSVLTAQALASGQLELATRASDLLDLPHAATLAQLLAHTGSVAHYSPQIAVDLDRDYATAHSALVTVLPHLLGETSGDRYRYSTFGYTIVGAMLEAASGRSFNELLGTLASEQSLASLTSAEDGVQMTSFYALNGRGISEARSRNFSYAVPGAGMAASASDLAVLTSRFAIGKVVDAATRDQMLRVQRLNAGEEVVDQRYRVALGWRLQADASGRLYYHHGGVTDGARSVVMFDLQSGRSVALLSNASWTSDVYAIALSLLRVGNASVPSDWADPADSPQLLHEQQTITLLSDSCSAMRCRWRSADSGDFGSWLDRSGRGSELALEIGLFGARIYDAYGAAALVRTESGERVFDQGSKRLRLR